MGTIIAKLEKIEISKIVQGVQRIREVQEDDSLVELAESIARRGLLQPIGVAALEDGTFQLLWGARRLAAHVRLGESRILARVMPEGADEVRAVAVVENLLRKQLTLEEECEAVWMMSESEGKSVEQIAAAISKSRSWVLNRMMVPALPDFLREPLLDGSIKIAHVEALVKVESESAQRYLVSCAIQQRMTAGQLKNLAQVYIDSPSVETAGHLPQTAPAPAMESKEPMFPCESCGRVGPISSMVFVRVHKDGCGTGSVEDRSNSPGGGVDGVEGGDKHDGGGENSGAD